MAWKKTSTKEIPRRLPKVYQEAADKRLKERIAKREERKEALVETVEPKKKEEVKVTKFRFLSQFSRLANYTGPSGMNYIINIGIPFIVKDKADIAFFESNKRFKKVTILSKEPEKPKDLDEQLKEYLEGIQGISEKTVEEVVKQYISKDNLVDELQQGYKMVKSIPNTHAEKIKEHVLKEIKGDK